MERHALFRIFGDVRHWRESARRHRRAEGLWQRLAVRYRLARRRAYAEWPLHGNPATMLAEGRLDVGDGVVLHAGVMLEGGRAGRILIGDGTSVGAGTQISALRRVTIGTRCRIATGCIVADCEPRDASSDGRVSARGMTTKGPTRIGDHVSLGAHVVVTSGVSIGDRCVIGANSVVSDDIPPYSVAAGSPARVVGRVDGAPTLAPVPDDGRLRAAVVAGGRAAPVGAEVRPFVR